MDEGNIIDADDKLNIIYDKINFIISIIFYIDFDKYSLNSNDMIGFWMILRDLQDEIKEVKELMK